MVGELKADRIEEVLNSQSLGRLGCHLNGLTYVVPINYVYDGQHVYALSKEGVKMTMMRGNPKVCFEVDVIKDMSNWESVIAWGDFEEITQPGARVEALQILKMNSLALISSVATHGSSTWPFLSTESDEIHALVFRIRLTKKTGRFENKKAPPFFLVTGLLNRSFSSAYLEGDCLI